jgi:hypothetical protein
MNLSLGRDINVNDSFGEPRLFEHFNDKIDSYVPETEYASVNQIDNMNQALKTVTEEKIDVLQEKLESSEKKLEEAKKVINNNLMITKEEILKSTLPPLKIISNKAEKDVSVIKSSIKKITQNNNSAIEKITKQNSKAFDEVNSSIKSLESSFNEVKNIGTRLNFIDKKTADNSLRIINSEEKISNVEDNIEKLKPYVLDTIKSEVKDYVNRYEESRSPVLLQIMNESMSFFSEGILILEDKFKENSIIFLIVIAIVCYIVYTVFIDSKKNISNDSNLNIMNGGGDILNYLSTISSDSF